MGSRAVVRRPRRRAAAYLRSLAGRPLERPDYRGWRLHQRPHLAGPNSRVTQFTLFGDNPGFLECHWRGLRNLSGNAFILTGVAMLALLSVVAVRMRHASVGRHA